MPKLRDKIVPPLEHPRTEGGWWYYLSTEWSNVIEGLLTPLLENYRWDWSIPERAIQAIDWVPEIAHYKTPPIEPIIIDTCPPCDIPFLPSGIEIIGNVINIYECENPDMIVNFYGCGCGCNGSTQPREEKALRSSS